MKKKAKRKTRKVSVLMPPALYEAVAQRAEANRRSISSEMIVIVHEVVK